MRIKPFILLVISIIFMRSVADLSIDSERDTISFVFKFSNTPLKATLTALTMSDIPISSYIVLKKSINTGNVNFILIITTVRLMLMFLLFNLLFGKYDVYHIFYHLITVYFASSLVEFVLFRHFKKKSKEIN